MISSISWTDDEGVATLSNEKPNPATRFSDWVVSRRPVGNRSIQVSTGATFSVEFRRDQTVSFSIHAIPESSMELMGRLEYHLLNGYTVALAGDREMADQFSVCTLEPETEPDFQQSDSGTREYTMSFVLRGMSADEITSIPGWEPHYPPGSVPGSGGGGGCTAIDSGTLTSGSLDITGAVKGDNFSDWTSFPDQYSDFLTDTETNPNYEDGVTPSGVNNPAPGTFWERNFDWDTNAFVVNRNRVGQLNVSGGHRTIKAIKQIEDGERYQFGFELETNGKVNGYVFESLWAINRFKFSDNFAVYDEDDPNGRGILLIDCDQTHAEAGASPARTFNAGVYNYGYYPLSDPEGYGGTALVEDVLLGNMSWSVSGGGSGSYQVVLGTMRELVFTGTEREVLLYAGHTFDEDGFAIDGEFRMAVWMRDVGGSWTNMMDHTLTGLTHPFKTGDIVMFRATDPWVLKPEQGDVMCYQCGGWALYNGNGFEEDGVWDPFVADGSSYPARALTTIEITPDPFSVDEGDTQPMTPAGFDQLGNPIATGTITWDSSDDAKATVDSSGVVTGVASGSCTITATVGAISSNAAACTVETPASGIPAVVQANIMIGVDGLVMDSSVAIGNKLWVMIASYAQSTSGATVTCTRCSGGFIEKHAYTGAGDIRTAIFVGTVDSAGTATINTTAPDSGFSQLGGIEVSGGDDTLDASADVTHAAPPTSASHDITTVAANCLILGFLNFWYSANSIDDPAGAGGVFLLDQINGADGTAMVRKDAAVAGVQSVATTGAIGDNCNYILISIPPG